jgi:hypothetical protein
MKAIYVVLMIVVLSLTALAQEANQIPWPDRLNSGQMTIEVFLVKEKGKIYLCANGQAEVNSQTPKYAQKAYTITAATNEARIKISNYLGHPVSGLSVKSREFDGQTARVVGRALLKNNKAPKQTPLLFLKYNNGELTPIIMKEVVEGNEVVYAAGDAPVVQAENTGQTYTPAVFLANNSSRVNLQRYLGLKKLKNTIEDEKVLTNGEVAIAICGQPLK